MLELNVEPSAAEGLAEGIAKQAHDSDGVGLLVRQWYVSEMQKEVQQNA